MPATSERRYSVEARVINRAKSWVVYDAIDHAVVATRLNRVNAHRIADALELVYQSERRHLKIGGHHAAR